MTELNTVQFISGSEGIRWKPTILKREADYKLCVSICRLFDMSKLTRGSSSNCLERERSVLAFSRLFLLMKLLLELLFVGSRFSSGLSLRGISFICERSGEDICAGTYYFSKSSACDSFLVDFYRFCTSSPLPFLFVYFLLTKLRSNSSRSAIVALSRG